MNAALEDKAGTGTAKVNETSAHTDCNNENNAEITNSTSWKKYTQHFHTGISTLTLLVNYFLAQYDKFILSYFQTPLSQSLGLSATQYSLLSGYATGIVYALCALPTAFLADSFPSARVWTLTIAAAWWSLCVIFQSLARNFRQLLLARIAMGIGQACVEPLSVSLVSDLMPAKGWGSVFWAEGVFYVGVYIGEAISGRISTAFRGDGDRWRVALRAIGITGVVVAVVLKLVVRDRRRRKGLVASDGIFREGKSELTTTVQHLVRMRSFWLLLLSASARQLAGNVFGYYMPSYLSGTFPDRTNLLTNYGIIVGVVGTFAVLFGGTSTSLLWNRIKTTPLYLTAIGGMLASPFVLLMLFSKDLTGVSTLYGSMAAAYLTAELWLGALNGLVASLLSPKHKTFGLAIWSSIQVLIYSSGPEIVGLALRNTDPGSEQYRRDTKVVLAVIIVVCYWLAGLGFLGCIPLLKRDLENGVSMESKIPHWRLWMLCGSGVILGGLVVSLFVASIVYAAT